MSDKSNEPTFTLTLRAEGPGPPAIHRLRRLLKAALRAYGLRCVYVSEVKPDLPESTSDTTTPTAPANPR